MSLLSVEKLKVTYKLERAEVLAINDISFSIKEGEIVGIVGESGCGKTTVAKALLGILPANGRISQGHINYKDWDLAKLSEEEMRRVRWKEIAMIPQSAMNSLNPVYSVGNQIVEAIQVHEKTSYKAAWARAEETFALVGLEAKRLKAYPHQLSGGMRQRAVIAMALILRPGLIIADEPTTALDVLVQDRILKEIIAIQRKIQNSMVFITHDIGVVAETCHRVIVMYAGRIAEVGDAGTIFSKPCHPYTMGLQNAFPKISDIEQDLISIPGYPPSLINPPQRCLFAERCPFAGDICWAQIPLEKEVEPGHFVFCHFTDQAQDFRAKAAHRETWLSRAIS